MSKKNKVKAPPLEEGLIKAMKALDNQIARAMQKDVARREEEGFKKHENFKVKIEEVTGLILNAFGEDKVGFDSFLILSQAYIKALYLISEDLGKLGLGKIRTEYISEAINNIDRDLKALKDEFSANEVLN